MRRRAVLVLRTLAAYMVVPNLLFLLGGLEFETLPRAFVNLDYLLVGMLAPIVGGWGAMGLMFLALLTDALRSCGSIYYFSQRDTVSALMFVRELSFAQVAEVTLCAMISIGLCSWLITKLGGSGDRKLSNAWVGVFALSLGAVGVWGGTSSLRFRDDAATANLCTSAGISMAKTVWAAATRKSDYVAPVPVESATRRAGWFDHVPRSRNLVLVTVESAGEPNDLVLRELLNATFDTEEIKRKYQVERGEVAFSGATVPGEYRELCGVASGVIDRPQDIGPSCLPWKLRSAGFLTTYSHGFSPSIFDRSSWVSGLGFTTTKFHEQLSAEGLGDCGGPFRGICDEEVVAAVGDELAREPDRRQFVSILTLNSHLPVTPSRNSSAILGCGTKDAKVADDATCDLLALVIRAERAVARVALRPDLPTTEFIIVGDHAPPFLQKRRRETFSQKVVPYTRLVPKGKEDSPSK